MAKVREMAMPLPLAMSLVMAVAIAMPLPSAVAIPLPSAVAMPLAMPLFCWLFLNCRHLYYLWILKFYMGTFWIAANSEPSPNTFTPYPCK